MSPEPTRHGRGERVRIYHGAVRLTAELSDFTALGELTTRLADLELTRVDGPWWALRPGSPAHREARRQAVQEAVQRAREYAEALGTSLTALVEIADVGLGRPQGSSQSRGRTRMVSGHGASVERDEAAPLDLEPERQHVHAQLDARFTVAPPRL
ncbi:SIMPL domain-containing protein [Streptomyces sp. NPDC001292]|uniref:SIMPL domain-containing protein n=1 Tax=Streptomyces sp. NPDC001292 TaxID=3364558 RepID=UPI0036D1EAF0